MSLARDRDVCCRRQWRRVVPVSVLSLGNPHGLRIGRRLLAAREPPAAGGDEQNEVDQRAQGMPRSAATCAAWMLDPAPGSAASLSHL